MTKLKPCPFCGSEANNEGQQVWGWSIHCISDDCDCEMAANSEQEAIQKWNNRAPINATECPHDFSNMDDEGIRRCSMCYARENI